MASIPKDWNDCVIGDLVRFSGGSQPPKSTFIHEPRDGYIRLIQIRDYKTDKFATYIPENRAQKFCEPDDIMIARYGPPIFQILRGLKGAYNVALIKAIPDETRVYKEYLYYFLQQEDLFQLIDGLSQRSSGQTGIEMDALNDYPFPLPPLEEQRKIAEILTTWDEAIALTEALIAALGRRKQALMQVLLTGEVRFQEFEGEWEEAELGEIVTLISRSEAVEPDKEYKLIGVRWYLAGAHIHEIRFGSDIVTSNLSRIQKDDILYNKMWVTKAAFGVAKEEHDGAYGTSEYPQFIARPNILDVHYLEYAFHDFNFQHNATSLCRGTTGRARLNPSDFLRIKLNLPALDEQIHISDLLQLLDEEIDICSKWLEQLRTQKRGLMQQLLTGAVRV